MVALSASKLVCSAIDEITFSTLPISWLLTPSLAMVCLVARASATARLVTADAAMALEEISRMLTLSSSTPVDTCCILPLTCVAAAAAEAACAVVSSALALI